MRKTFYYLSHLVDGILVLRPKQTNINVEIYLIFYQKYVRSIVIVLLPTNEGGEMLYEVLRQSQGYNTEVLTSNVGQVSAA